MIVPGTKTARDVCVKSRIQASIDQIVSDKSAGCSSVVFYAIEPSIAGRRALSFVCDNSIDPSLKLTLAYFSLPGEFAREFKFDLEIC